MSGRLTKYSRIEWGGGGNSVLYSSLAELSFADWYPNMGKIADADSDPDPPPRKNLGCNGGGIKTIVL